jgi:DNA modification methylase
MADIQTCPGDLFLLGEHRLLCGDSRDTDALRILLDDNFVQHIFAGTPCFNQKDYAQWEDYAAYNDDMSQVIANCLSVLKPGGILVWHVGNDSSHHHDTVARQSALLEASGLIYSDTIIWRKTAANYAIPRNSHIQRNHCYYPAFQWEALLVFQRPGGQMPRMTRDAAEYMARHHTNVWDIAAISHPLERHGHPGPCPVELPYRCFLAYSRPGALVLDPFAGSGTSLMACEKTHRKARVIERIPRYCDIIVKRWEQLTGKKAERISSAEHPEHQ